MGSQPSTTPKPPDTVGFGPEVTDVMIGSSGRCKVTISGDIYFILYGNGARGGRMAYETTGATTRAASDYKCLSLWYEKNVGGALSTDMEVHAARGTYTIVETGLNPELHTFTAKYMSVINGTVIEFADGVILVEPF
jgi:hypothetical protein